MRSRNGQKSPYKADGTYDFTTHQIFECSSRCACNSKCTLRTAQRGLYCPMVVCCIGDKGLGVMTTAAIPPGTFVCEYSGEAVTRRSLERQEEKKQRRTVQRLGSFVTYAIEINDKTKEHYVDSEKVGNISRFFNHSCEPNLRPIKVDRGETMPTLCFFTLSHVPAGAELTWTYRRGSNVKSGLKCRCGKERCSGYM